MRATQLGEREAAGELQELELSAMDLSGLPVCTLIAALVKIPRVCLNHASLTVEQLSFLLQEVTGGSTCLRHLDVEYNSLEGLQESLLEAGGTKLDTFWYTAGYDAVEEETYYDNFNGEDEEYDEEDEQWSS